MDTKTIQIGECLLGTIGWILLLPVIIITSPVMPFIYAQDRENLISIIRMKDEQIQILSETKQQIQILTETKKCL